jgi:hypothetical protein
MIIPEESPFFIPGGRLGLAASGGSTFNLEYGKLLWEGFDTNAFNKW